MTDQDRPRPTAPKLGDARWRKSRHSETDQRLRRDRLPP